jgi:DeoR/GlpR family transcriptional regulator of sugar metabolism
MLLANSDIFDTVVLGGKVNKSYTITFSEDLESMRSQNTVDKIFIGADGISLEHGLTSFDMTDVEVNKILLKKAKMIIVLLDHTKFDKVLYGNLLDLERIDLLITDDNLPKKTFEKYSETGLKIITANTIGF